MAVSVNGQLWSNVTSLVDRAASVDDLRAHRLQWLAASIWLADGRAVPAALKADRRYAATMALGAPIVLERARAAFDGTLLLIKGPEVAACYPEQSARHYRDVDLLTDEPARAQQALVRAGFEEEQFPGGWDEPRHLPPLRLPGIPLCIELHGEPNRPPWLPPANVAEILASAAPSRTGVDGLLAPDDSTHALLLAAHAWAHRPLGRVGDLVDIAMVLGDDARSEVAQLAARWGWAEMWSLTVAALDAVTSADRPTLPLRLLGRNQLGLRDATVLEFHLQRLLLPLLAVPRERRLGQFADAWRQLGGRSWDESWREKLSRSARALRHAQAPKTEHDISTNNHPWAR